LTPATGARTTWLDRTQLHRSSARRSIAHGSGSIQNPPCHHVSRPTLPRPPHPAPTSVTMANAPLSERDGESLELIWVSGEAEYFFKRGWTPGSTNFPSGKSLEIAPCLGSQNWKAQPQRPFPAGPSYRAMPAVRAKAEITLRRQNVGF